MDPVLDSFRLSPWICGGKYKVGEVLCEMRYGVQLLYKECINDPRVVSVIFTYSYSDYFAHDYF